MATRRPLVVVNGVTSELPSGDTTPTNSVAPGAARQLLQTNAAGTATEWTNNVDIPGTLDVTSAATFDNSVAVTGALTKSGNNVVTVGDTGTVTSTMIADGTIVNDDINASAAIAGTKISPDFGSQNVTTTGTATAASLIPSSSTVPTNGVYLPAANTVGISTGGSGRLFIDSSGRLGVGTSSPALFFDCAGTGTGVAYFRTTDTGSSNNINIVNGSNFSAGVIGVVSGTGGSGGDVYGLGHSANPSATDLTPVLTWTSGNRVGIGTSAPTQALDVNGNIKVGANQRVMFGPAGYEAGIKYSTNGTLQISARAGEVITFNNGEDGAERLRITSTGLVGIGTSSVSALLHAKGAGGSTSGSELLRLETTQATGGNWISFTDASARKGYIGYKETADDNFYIANEESGHVVIPGTTRLGIGTTPVTTLDVNGGCQITGSASGYSGGEVRLGATTADLQHSITTQSTGSPIMFFDHRGTGNAGIFAWRRGTGASSEGMRLDGSGRLLVGTSTSRSLVGLQGNLQLESTGAGATFQLTRNSNDNAPPYLVFGKSRGTSNGSNTAVQNGDLIGSILFSAADGNDSDGFGAEISAVIDGTPGSNDLPSRLVFSTTADGASSPTERMRIGNDGFVTVGSFGGTNVTTIPGSDVPRFEFYNSNVGTMTLGYRGPSAPSNANTAELRVIVNSPLVFSTNNTTRMTIAAGGSVSIVGALSKGSGSFRINHPLPEKKDTHQLVHSFIEGPQADLIYRGHVCLKDGKAEINIDQVSRMTEGTFEVLCRDVCCFTTNETDWTPVRGSVTGNILTIEAQDPTSTADICWMVIGERKDKHMYDTDWTDENGKVITEPMKEVTIHEAQ